MKRSLIFAICVCVVITSSASGQDGLKKLWPFGGKSKNSRLSESNDYFDIKPVRTKKTLGLPSPTKMFDRVERGTGTVVDKTRKTFGGMQEFGKSLNPFTRNSKKTRKKESLWRRMMMMEQSKAHNNPATVTDFLALERPPI
jgi:hypothetical protein